MKIIYVNCGWRREYESNLRSNEHYLSSNENKAWKNSGLYGIWIHDLCNTGAVLYQLTNKPTGSWSLCWFRKNLWSDKASALIGRLMSSDGGTNHGVTSHFVFHGIIRSQFGLYRLRSIKQKEEKVQHFACATKCAVSVFQGNFCITMMSSTRHSLLKNLH